MSRSTTIISWIAFAIFAYAVAWFCASAIGGAFSVASQHLDTALHRALHLPAPKLMP